MKLEFDFRRTGPPISQEALSDFERHLSARLPEDYKQFLLAYNGGYPAREVFEYDGDKSFVVQRFYPIASDDAFHVRFFSDANGEPVTDLLEIGMSSFGDRLCLGLGTVHFGSVWWHDHEHDPDDDPHDGLTNLAPTFEQFVRGLTAL